MNYHPSEWRRSLDDKTEAFQREEPMTLILNDDLASNMSYLRMYANWLDISGKYHQPMVCRKRVDIFHT